MAHCSWSVDFAQRHRMRRFEEVLDLLPPGLVLDGELVVLDDAGRPLFNKLLFGCRRPTYVAFDLLIADGVDLRPLPLSDRKARLAQIARRAESWIALTDGVVGAGRALYRAVVEADLEGIVAKKLAGPYNPQLAGWHKVLTRDLYEVARVKKFFRDQHSSLPTFQEGVHVSAVLH
jgi:ATP-dependent DNA ligase